MKICYIAGSVIPSRTANSVHVMKMCQAYARLGHQVTLVVPNHPDSIEPNVSDIYEYYGVSKNFEIIWFEMFRPLKLWYSIVMSMRAIMATKADIYHTRILWSAWGLTTLFRRPTIFEIHDVPPPGSLLERCLRSTSGRRNLKLVVSITTGLAGCISHLISKSANVVVLPDGVDQQFVDSPLTQQQARSDLGLQNDQQFLVVYAGHLYPGRGTEVVVELARRHSEFQFLVVGGREEEIDRWRSETAECRNLTFAGFVAPRAVFSYLRAADALLMPYSHEVSHAGEGNTSSVMSPMKMFEYMASKRPILASDLPILQEVLRPEVNCLVASYGDVDTWSRQLSRLHADSTLRTRIGEQALKDVAQYSWESRSKKLLAAISVPECVGTKPITN